MARASLAGLIPRSTQLTGSRNAAPHFSKRAVQRVQDFSGGLNNKFAPQLIADNEISDVQNMNLDQKGTLQKRLGIAAHYTGAFATGPVRGLFNYRKEDGSSRLIIAADDKLFYDTPKFTQTYQLETDWEATGTSQLWTSTTQAVKSVEMQWYGIGMMELATGTSQLSSPASRPQAIWTSQAINVSTVTTFSSGLVSITETLPTSTSLVVETRTDSQSSMATASAWAALGAGNTIASPSNTYLQIRLRMNSTNGNIPSTSYLQVSFNTAPAVTTLTTGNDTLARYTFATQNDILYIVNGVNAMQKWDGTTFGSAGGSPPLGQYVVVHKNYMFITGNPTSNRSRLYFSDLGNPESWPALNFIDVGKGDGDRITGMYILLDQLVVTKNSSVWLLQGSSPTNFVLREMVVEQGSVNQQGFAPIRGAMAMLSRDAVRFFDGVRSAIASEKIEGTFNGLNQQQLAQCAGVTFKNHYYLSVPKGTSTTNSVILVFDLLRTAWYIYAGPTISEWVIWRQQGADTLLGGDATTGQVYDMWTGLTDNGAAIDAWATTKAFQLGGSEEVKMVRSVYVTSAEASGGTTTETVTLFKDKGSESASMSATITGPLEVKRFVPSTVNVSIARTLAVKVRNNDTAAGMNLYDILVEYTDHGLRAMS